MDHAASMVVDSQRLFSASQVAIVQREVANLARARGCHLQVFVGRGLLNPKKIADDMPREAGGRLVYDLATRTPTVSFMGDCDPGNVPDNSVGVDIPAVEEQVSRNLQGMRNLPSDPARAIVAYLRRVGPAEDAATTQNAAFEDARDAEYKRKDNRAALQVLSVIGISVLLAVLAYGLGKFINRNLPA